MMLTPLLDRFRTFREQLHALFLRRADALMDIVDSVAGNTQADSPVKLSLSPLFPRCYSSLHGAVAHFDATPAAALAPSEVSEPPTPGADSAPSVSAAAQPPGAAFTRLIVEQLPRPTQRPFWLLATDVTPAPRPFARTLADRGIGYAPNPAPGNRPIAVGHSYSAVVVLPEKPTAPAPPWVVPVSLLRVPSTATGTDVGAQQLNALLTDEQLPFGRELTVDVVDSAYSAVSYLAQVGDATNLVTVARLPGNRVVYRSPEPTAAGRGHPRWYGERFTLDDPQTWGSPDEVVTLTETTPRGRVLSVCVQVWYDMKRRGKRGRPMHRYPFTLLRCTVTDANGHAVFKRSLWLIVIGRRRADITPQQAWSSYRQRYDIEHFFRFGKQRLLMASYQTPEVEHEENWWQLASLAYVQLWLAQPLAQALPNPWERYARPADTTRPLSPALVQRDFERIIRQVGTPAQPPKPRGKSPGRRPGACLGRRPVQPVVIKTAKKALPQAP